MPGGDGSAPDLHEGDPELVHQLDAVGLGALAAGHEDLGRAECRHELAVGLGITFDHRGDLGAEALTIGREFGVVPLRRGRLGRQPHPVDGRQREVGVGLPRG